MKSARRDQRADGDGDGTGRHRGLKITVAILAAAILAVVAYIYLPVLPLNKMHAKYEISQSSKFTDAQIRGAFSTVEKNMSDMWGCTLETVKYDEQQSDVFLGLEERAGAKNPGASVAYSKGIAVCGIAKIAATRTSFTCNEAGADYGYGSGENGFTTYLALTGTATAAGEWKILDQGNA